MSGSRVTIATPEGELKLELPLPGLYNVYNALAAITAALCSGISLDLIRQGLESMVAVFGRVETIEVAGKPVSILLIKNPAGANEVLRTLALESSGDGIDLWIALNDRIADGRDVSWIWDADFELLTDDVRRVVCAGTRAPEMALRLKYAGWPQDRIEVSGPDRPLARRRRRRRPRPPVRAADLHGPARAADAAVGPRSRKGVLGMSRLRRAPKASTSEQAIWQDVEFGAYTADLPLWKELAAAADGPVLELGSGSGRVALHLAKDGYRVIALERDPELVEALASRADGLPVTVLQANLMDLGDEWAQAALPEPGSRSPHFTSSSSSIPRRARRCSRPSLSCSRRAGAPRSRSSTSRSLTRRRLRGAARGPRRCATSTAGSTRASRYGCRSPSAR